MLKLNAKIKVYETLGLIPTPKSYEFTYVKNVKIDSSYKTLTDTATITMPKKVFTNTKGFDKNNITKTLFSSKEQTILDYFKLENFVEIYLGYDNEYKPAFRGYVTGVNSENKSSFVDITCEDSMYALKKVKAVGSVKSTISSLIGDKFGLLNAIETNPTVNEESFNPKTFFEKRIKQLKLPIKVNAIDEDMGNFLISRNHTIAQVLEKLKEKGIFTYFKVEETGPVLNITNNPQNFASKELKAFVDRNYIKNPLLDAAGKALLNKGLDLLSSKVESFTNAYASKLYPGKVRLRFKHNIITDDLKVVKEATNNSRIRIEKYFSNSNSPIAVELGDPNGQLLKTIVLHDDKETLPTEEADFKKKAQKITADLIQYAALRSAQNKVTRLKGKIITFGEPFVRPSDKVILENAKDQDKNGTFQVEAVTRTYGENGYRQEISLGRKIELI